jgi:hypothetical protein
MRGRLLAAACGVALVCLASAGGAAAPSLAVKDPQGYYWIAVPSDWHMPASPGLQDPGVLLVVEGPERGGFAPTVSVQSKTLQRPFDPSGFANTAKNFRLSFYRNYAVTQEGDTTIDGRPAHFIYFTWQGDSGPSMYDLQVYFTSGLNGWIVTGFTLADPQRVREDFPTITQIVNSFRLIAR